MDRVLGLLADNESAGGRAVTSVVLVVLAIILAAVAGWIVGRRFDDPFTRFHVRKAVRYAVENTVRIASRPGERGDGAP